MTICRYQSSVAHTRTSLVVPDDIGLNESCYMLIIAVMVAALICFLGILVLAFCVKRRMKKKKIDQVIPKFIYNSSKEDKGCGNYGSLCLSECAICLSEYVDGDEISVFPQLVWFGIGIGVLALALAHWYWHWHWRIGIGIGIGALVLVLALALALTLALVFIFGFALVLGMVML
ncbi:hypothetical protein Tco_1193177 [Tanacetum coccineum]